ncbi:MAG: response regulator [Clostridia bacterium]|nr:response regulator [Clostridia bacterium]
MKEKRKIGVTGIAVIGSLLTAALLVGSALWLGSSTRKDTEEAVHSVSLLYLEELTKRREQIVEDNLNARISTIRVAIELMDEDDLSDEEHLHAYQSRMKKLFTLDKFAFVDTDGLIYTSLGNQTNIQDYSFDYRSLSQPDISTYAQDGGQLQVIVAVPVNIPFQGKSLSVCFMAINMDDMLSVLSMSSDTNGTTFCNLYNRDGRALTNAVLGGLASEDNLLSAMSNAKFEQPYSYDGFISEFRGGSPGGVTFSYDGVLETLSYMPVAGTDWQLTYLIRENVISDRIGSITRASVWRNVAQSVIMLLAVLIMFLLIRSQIAKNDRLKAEQDRVETENRVKHEELERRIALQEELLKEQSQSEQQSKLITALSSDYWSVYYVELDEDRGTCYQSHSDLGADGLKVGDQFPYRKSVAAYAERYVAPRYREEFLQFVDPDGIRERLGNSRVTSYTYLVERNGTERYETVRFAGVRHPEDREDHLVHTVGACFVDSDEETRKTMEQNQMLADALAAAEEASRAKTVFLSSMSHEIRTPMNTIIGLDKIALTKDTLDPETREQLEKIGGAADHLLSLINNILDISRIEAGRMTLNNEEFSFHGLIQQINTIIGGQCQDKNLEYHCSLQPGFSDFYFGDDIKLKQVLINILGNAVKFTPEGGSVSLSAERCSHFDHKSVIRFTVSDTGIGMDASYLPRIFEAFSQEDSGLTNKYGSTGLGMTITKNIVDMMNGTISVESEKGKGTTFTVTVTLQDSAREDDADFGELHPHELSVLIVDDDPIAGEHARLVLEKVGIASDLAASGAEALDMVRLHHARHHAYNLILMDWKMPEMDGLEATRQIRDLLGKDSAVIILTAYNWEDITDEALEAGVNSFIAKPLSASSVIDEFQSALKRAGGTHPAHHAELAGRRILLAEDILMNAEIMMDILDMRDVIAEHAENGRIAVEMFESHPEGYYDAILMDMRMPETDGLEATRRIRALPRPDAKSIPIIALTANAFDEDVQQCLQAGMDAHLSKPVETDLLFETLETLIP